MSETSNLALCTDGLGLAISSGLSVESILR